MFKRDPSIKSESILALTLSPRIGRSSKKILKTMRDSQRNRNNSRVRKRGYARRGGRINMENRIYTCHQMKRISPSMGSRIW